MENTLEVVRTDGPAAPGSTYEERNQVLGPWHESSRWEVTEVRPPLRQVHRGAGFFLADDLQLVIELEPVSDHETELTMTLDYDVRYEPLTWALGRIVGLAVGRSQAQSLRNLQAIAERELG